MKNLKPFPFIIFLILLITTSSCKKTNSISTPLKKRPVNNTTYSADKPMTKIPEKTVITLHPETKIEKGYNYIWCGTGQLAWNEGKKRIGSNIRLKPYSKTAELLNRKPYIYKRDIPEGISLGFSKRNSEITDEFLTDFTKQIDKLSHGSYSSQLLDDLKDRVLPGFTVYSLIYNKLSFRYPFTCDKHRSIWINDNTYLSFGSSSPYEDKNYDKTISQIIIHHYKNDDNFVVELKTDKPDEQLILAKLGLRKTLKATISQALQKVKHGRKAPFRDIDTLKVPVLNFNFKAENLLVGDIQNKKFHNFILRLDQVIQFSLNEKGAVIVSEASGAIEAGADPEAPTPKHLVFDTSYLIMLKKKGKARPYYALWVGNDELYSKLPERL